MDEKKQKKKFIKPEMEIIEFNNEVTTMNSGGTAFWGGENW